MQRKYFFQDKNYILKQAQSDSREELLISAIRLTLENFLAIENPMGLKDDFIISLTSSESYNINFLSDFYEIAGAVYRYKFGDSQLEILWDGSSHYDYYRNEWKNIFMKWVNILSKHRSFTRIIIKACILFSDESHPMLKHQLTRILLTEFDLKLTRKKEIKAA